jgi:hypothetical protein
MANRIQLRRDSQSNWENINPILADGEPGLNYNNNQIKIGNGTDTWTMLSYATSSGGGLPGDFLDYGMVDTGSGNQNINLAYTYHWIVNLSNNPGAGRRYVLADGTTNGQTIYFVPSNPFEPTNTAMWVDTITFYNSVSHGYFTGSMAVQLFYTTGYSLETLIRATWINGKWVFSGPITVA